LEDVVDEVAFKSFRGIIGTDTRGRFTVMVGKGYSVVGTSGRGIGASSCAGQGK
jgi:hypothetical protein